MELLRLVLLGGTLGLTPRLLGRKLLKLLLVVTRLLSPLHQDWPQHRAAYTASSCRWAHKRRFHGLLCRLSEQVPVHSTRP